MSLTQPGVNVPVGTELRFRLIQSDADLETVRHDWRDLLEASASAEPMLDPDWLLTWRRVYAPGGRLCVGLFFASDRLVGLAPLGARRHWYRPGIPFRRLEPLGSDVAENDGVCSDYLNLLVRAGFEEATAQAFARKLKEGAFGPWDELVMPTMAGDGPMPELLASACRQGGLKVDLVSANEAPFIPLPETWEAYLKYLNKKKRHLLVKTLKDFDAWAGEDVQLERADTPASLEIGRRILLDLHQTRWEKKNSAGVFDSPRFRTFHDFYMKQLLERDQLELIWLMVRGRPVAVHYSIRANGKIYFYQCGRAMDLPPEQRIGVVMLAYAIREAIGRGLREFDFLAGTSVYKSQLTMTSRPLVDLRITRGGIRELTKNWAERAIHGLRSLRNRFRAWRHPPRSSNAAPPRPIKVDPLRANES